MNYAQLPKIELHLHLDCSLSYSVVHAIDNTISEEQYQKEFVAPPVCADLRDYLTRAVKGFSLMQTPAQLRLVTLDLLAQLEADQVIYAEIRFAPLFTHNKACLLRRWSKPCKLHYKRVSADTK